MVTRFREIPPITREQILEYLHRDELERQVRNRLQRAIDRKRRHLSSRSDFVPVPPLLRTDSFTGILEIQFPSPDLTDEERAIKLSKIEQFKIFIPALDTCSICCDETLLDCKLNCGHLFHYLCIYTWINHKIKDPTCPNCRKVIEL